MKIIKYPSLLILAFSGFLIYSNTFNAPFIFDDEVYIKDNPGIRNLSNFKDFSGTRYITFLSFAINYYFGGLNTFGYHLVNIIIHTLNAILVYVLIQLTLETSKCRQWAIGNCQLEKTITYSLLPFACSIIFLVHPIQTQAVTYITQRFTSLAALFYLLALVLYVKARGKGQKPLTISLTPYAFSLFFTILAMKTKEFSFTLPFIIIVYEFTFFSNNDSRHTTLNSRLLYLIPYLLTLLIIPLELLSSSINPAAQGLGYNLQRELSAKWTYNRFLTPFIVIVKYIRLLILPINQHYVYDNLSSKPLFEIKTFLSLASVISIFCFAVYLYIRSLKTNNTTGLLISFGIFWFFITLSMNLIMAVGVIIEHWLYLPSIGFILSVVAGYFHLFDRINNKSIKKIFFIIIVIPVLSYAAYERNSIYKDKVTLWLNEIKFVPHNSYARNELGNAYLEKGMFDEAQKEFEKAIELDSKSNPMYSTLFHYNLGLVYFMQIRLEEAVREYSIALEFYPYNVDAHNSLGNVYSFQDRFDEAINEYIIALILKPKKPAQAGIYNNIGLIYFKKGLWSGAIKAYLNALEINPDFAQAHYNLGNVYSKLGEIDNAINEYLAALKIYPDIPDIHYNLGDAYRIKGLKDEAIKAFEMALKLKPDFIPAKEALEDIERESVKNR